MTLLETINIFALCVISFLIALAVTPLLMQVLASRTKGKQIKRNYAAPVYEKFHSHKAGTPDMAGILIWGVVILVATSLFLLAFFFDGFLQSLSFVSRSETYLPIAALFLAGLFGLADDLLSIKIRYKLIVYGIFGLIGAYWFYIKLGWDTLWVPFVGDVIIGPWYVPFFILVIVASAFSMNEADGLDGLAGGAALFAFFALTVIAFVLGRYDLAGFGGAMIGALLAFLWFNIYPAKFFMGDTGSMALGATMGVFAMLTNTALLLPIIAPVLVIEAFSVIIQLFSKAFRGGKRVFLAAPIHNHFLARGWHETRVTMRFWIISAFGSALGLVIFFLRRSL